MAACLQVDATCHNAIIQEQSLGIHYNKSNDLLDYVQDRTKIGHNWKNPVWKHQDGSIAEW
ncbi:hypothetical protein HMPREF0790_1931 [Staphylococcus lugdunensis M23590]|nr:hypothetical protein HMPREF0790_1931 [Staphylococcus lugdunensis M23590]